MASLFDDSSDDDVDWPLRPPESGLAATTTTEALTSAASLSDLPSVHVQGDDGDVFNYPPMLPSPRTPASRSVTALRGALLAEIRNGAQTNASTAHSSSVSRTAARRRVSHSRRAGGRRSASDTVSVGSFTAALQRLERERSAVTGSHEAVSRRLSLSLESPTSATDAVSEDTDARGEFRIGPAVRRRLERLSSAASSVTEDMGSLSVPSLLRASARARRRLDERRAAIDTPAVTRSIETSAGSTRTSVRFGSSSLSLNERATASRLRRGVLMPPELEVYTKLLAMGMPPRAVLNKMRADGLSDINLEIFKRFAGLKTKRLRSRRLRGLLVDTVTARKKQWFEPRSFASIDEAVDILRSALESTPDASATIASSTVSVGSGIKTEKLSASAKESAADCCTRRRSQRNVFEMRQAQEWYSKHMGHFRGHVIRQRSEFQSKLVKISERMAALREESAQIEARKVAMAAAFEELKEAHSQLSVSIEDNMCAFLAKWPQWTSEEFLLWVLSLRKGYFKKYSDCLRKAVSRYNVNGEHLAEICKDDLLEFGVADYGDRVAIVRDLKQLVAKYPHSGGCDLRAAHRSAAALLMVPPSHWRLRDSTLVADCISDRSVTEDTDDTLSQASAVSFEDCIPRDFMCPITREVMRYPVIAADGHSYERESMERWIASCGGRPKSPKTNVPLENNNLIPNYSLRALIYQWLENANLTHLIVEDFH